MPPVPPAPLAYYWAPTPPSSPSPAPSIVAATQQPQKYWTERQRQMSVCLSVCLSASSVCCLHDTDEPSVSYIWPAGFSSGSVPLWTKQYFGDHVEMIWLPERTWPYNRPSKCQVQRAAWEAGPFLKVNWLAVYTILLSKPPFIFPETHVTHILHNSFRCKEMVEMKKKRLTRTSAHTHTHARTHNVCVCPAVCWGKEKPLVALFSGKGRINGSGLRAQCPARAP